MGGASRTGARPWARWALVGLWALILVAIVANGAYEGMAARDVERGGGVPGTVTLERRVPSFTGRGAPTWSWSGTFRSDDGSIVQTVQMEPLPREDVDLAEPNGGWQPGDQVRARWTSRTPDQGYLWHTQKYRYWIQSVVFLTVFGLLMAIAVLLVQRYRRRHADDPPDLAMPLAPRPPSEPSARDLAQQRIAVGQSDLDVLRAELGEIRKGSAGRP